MDKVVFIALPANPSSDRAILQLIAFALEKNPDWQSARPDSVMLACEGCSSRIGQSVESVADCNGFSHGNYTAIGGRQAGVVDPIGRQETGGVLEMENP